MNDQMTLSAFIIGNAQTQSRVVPTPPQPGPMDNLPHGSASIIMNNIDQTIQISMDDKLERNVDVVQGGSF